jgi:hypothetical protein
MLQNPWEGTSSLTLLIEYKHFPLVPPQTSSPFPPSKKRMEKRKRRRHLVQREWKRKLQLILEGIENTGTSEIGGRRRT